MSVREAIVLSVSLDLLRRPSVEVAPRLLGAVLTVGEVSVRLTEVEAYLGESDPGSHAFRGPGRRNAVMYGPPGRLYTYFTYGMHVCANVVCSPDGVAGGILLRAGEIVAGLELARSRRPTARRDAELACGPARLCVAAGIRLDDNGDDLRTGRVRLALAEQATPYHQGPRTGVAGVGGSADFPWRFWIPDEATVSPYKRHVPKRRDASGHGPSPEESGHPLGYGGGRG